jgi:uncharacterized protein YbbC (DUF1343 family)/CubicO group peptidase (beta-lactamase class C family)
MKISRRAVVAGFGLSPAALRGVPSFSGSSELDAAVAQAIRASELPGAVVLIGHRGRVIHREAYGHRAVVPRMETMTVDTIFDLASLTKVIATTPALMCLFEEGKIRLNDPVTKYLPEFQGGKSQITLRNLFTHFSGLRPDLDTDPAWRGYDTGIRRALAEIPLTPPGAHFLYSDINFVLLAEIVRRQAGMPLSEYARQRVFKPLGMSNTMFQPPARLRPHIAPTENVYGSMLRGVVHDDTARFMGGVTGHAGLFSTADDLARYAEMMLGQGEFQGRRLFSKLTIRKFTTPQSPPDQPILRGLGWDIDSPYSSSRGDLFPIGSYGHTGFTGTSLWIDPASETYVILLSNSVHPRRRPPMTSLRGRVATIAAASVGIEAPGITLTGYTETLSSAGVHRVVARNAVVQTGLEVLAAERFKPLAGMRIGLITNHTGIDRNGRRNVDLMTEAGIKVAALFAPEHGIEGSQDVPEIGETVDPATGIPVHSLYTTAKRRPTPEMLHNMHALVFDIQDSGARFYTYVTTMAYAMEAAAARGIPFFVLDRPNPITGVHVEGPLLDADLRSFLGYFSGLPLRHGMTVGELAGLFNTENKLGADLRVVAMKNWQRGDWFDSTGLPWRDPSPNLRSLTAALLYPGVAMLEAARNYSVGRGTDAPFEQTGADWILGPELAALLNSRFIPGIRFYPVRFRPASEPLRGRWLEGVRFVLTGREAFDSARLGLEIAAALHQLYPGKMNLVENRYLIGSRRVMEMIEAGVEPQRIQQEGKDSLRAFLKAREGRLLY